MGIDEVRLVLERSVANGVAAITRILTREGWRPTPERGKGSREIHTAKAKGGWVLTDKRDELVLAVSWVKAVTSELGSIGISVRASPDFGSFVIERLLAGEAKGHASLGKDLSKKLGVTILEVGVDAERSGSLATWTDGRGEPRHAPGRVDSHRQEWCARWSSRSVLRVSPSRRRTLHERSCRSRS